MSKRETSTEVVNRGSDMAQGGCLPESPVIPPSVRTVGIVGSRTLPLHWAEKVGDVTEDLLNRRFALPQGGKGRYHLATGGAMGADQYVIARLLRRGLSDQCSVYAAWAQYSGFPVLIRAMMRQFRDYGGVIFWGPITGRQPEGLVKMALLSRNERLVNDCYGLVAFLTADSRGTIHALKAAVKKRLVIVAFPVECSLPDIPDVIWRPIDCGGSWDGSYRAHYRK